MQLSNTQIRILPARLRQAGFGLVELLVGMAIGMIILAAASTALLSSLTSNRDSIRMSRLDQELRQVMTMISRDVRRATAWDPAVDVARITLSDSLTLSTNAVGAATVISTGENLGEIGDKAEGGTLVYYNGTTVYTATIGTFDEGNKRYNVTITGTDWPAAVTTLDGVPAGTWSILRPGATLTTDAVAGTPGECLLFNYDIDASGRYESNEFYGYRYDATDDAVEIRTSGAGGDTCTSGGAWENLTDENAVAISDFSVDITPVSVTSSGMTVTVWDFTISITGNLKKSDGSIDSAVQRTLQETIRVRNDGLKKT
jgi:Tfp pilus assembly protein PilW